MQFETEIEVRFRTSFGDSFDDYTDKSVVDDLIEKHIDDWCCEHGIDRQDVYIKSIWRTD